MCFALRAAQVTCCCCFLPPFKPISGLAELGIFSVRDFHSFLLRRPRNEETPVALTLGLGKLNSHRNGSQGCQNTSYIVALYCCIYNISLLKWAATDRQRFQFQSFHLRIRHISIYLTGMLINFVNHCGGRLPVGFPSVYTAYCTV